MHALGLLCAWWRHMITTRAPVPACSSKLGKSCLLRPQPFCHMRFTNALPHTGDAKIKACHLASPGSFQANMGNPAWPIISKPRCQTCFTEATPPKSNPGRNVHFSARRHACAWWRTQVLSFGKPRLFLPPYLVWIFHHRESSLVHNCHTFCTPPNS